MPQGLWAKPLNGGTSRTALGGWNRARPISAHLVGEGPAAADVFYRRHAIRAPVGSDLPDCLCLAVDADRWTDRRPWNSTGWRLSGGGRSAFQSAGSARFARLESSHAGVDLASRRAPARALRLRHSAFADA